MINAETFSSYRMTLVKYSIVICNLYYISCKIWRCVKCFVSFIFCRCKERHITNGNTGKVKYVQNSIVFLESPLGMLAVFPVFEDDCHQYYPLVGGYSSTVHKIMGEDLDHVTLAFDLKTLSPAVGYVALSRVSSFDNVIPMLRLRKSHFINIG